MFYAAVGENGGGQDAGRAVEPSRREHRGGVARMMRGIFRLDVLRPDACADNAAPKASPAAAKPAYARRLGLLGLVMRFLKQHNGRHPGA